MITMVLGIYIFLWSFSLEVPALVEDQQPSRGPASKMLQGGQHIPGKYTEKPDMGENKMEKRGTSGSGAASSLSTQIRSYELWKTLPRVSTAGRKKRFYGTALTPEEAVPEYEIATGPPSKKPRSAQPFRYRRSTAQKIYYVLQEQQGLDSDIDSSVEEWLQKKDKDRKKKKKKK